MTADGVDTGPELADTIREVAERSPEAAAIVVYDAAQEPRTRVRWCNEAMARLTGYPREEIIGNPCSAIHDPATEPQATHDINALYHAGRAATMETQNLRPDGAVYWMETRFEPLDAPGPDGIVRRWLLYCRETEAAGIGPVERSDLVARTINLSNDGFAVFDDEGRFEWANAAILRRMGMQLSEVRGRRFEDLVSQANRTIPTAAKLAACQARGETYRTEIHYRPHDGEQRMVEITAILVNGVDGRQHIVHTSHDLSQLRRQEAQLAQARERAGIMEQAIDSATEPVLLIDADARVVENNRAFTEMFGFSREEARGRRSFEVLQTSEADSAELQNWLADPDRPPHLEYAGERTTRDGRKLWLEITVSQLDGGGGEPRFLVLMRDRTEQRNLQRGSRRLTRLLSAALRATRSVAFTCNLRDGSVTRSEGFGEFLGRRLEGLPTGRGFLREIIHPADLPHCREVSRRLWTGESEQEEVEFRILHPVRGPFWVRSIGRVERDADGEPLASYGMFTDIDASKRSEAALRDAKSGAEAASQAKTSFLATMSHDIRTPMNVVTGMCQLLQLTDLDDRQRDYAGMIAQASADLMALIDDLLDLSRIEAGEMRLETAEFDIAEAVSQVAAAASVLPEAATVEIATELAAGLPVLRLGDPHRLRQVLTNLAVNAVKFTGGGRVTLRLMERSPDIVRIEVADTGPGIAAEDIPFIFEKYRRLGESTESRVPGSGLGLAICREIVGLMGGRIGVESALGEGATFWLELPLPRAKLSASA